MARVIGAMMLCAGERRAVLLPSHGTRVSIYAPGAWLFAARARWRSICTLSRAGCVGLAPVRAGSPAPPRCHAGGLRKTTALAERPLLPGAFAEPAACAVYGPRLDLFLRIVRGCGLLLPASCCGGGCFVFIYPLVNLAAPTAVFCQLRYCVVCSLYLSITHIYPHRLFTNSLPNLALA